MGSFFYSHQRKDILALLVALYTLFPCVTASEMVPMRIFIAREIVSTAVPQHNPVIDIFLVILIPIHMHF